MKCADFLRKMKSTFKISKDFGLYREDGGLGNSELKMQKQKSPIKFVLGASLLGCALLGAVYGIYILNHNHDEDLILLQSIHKNHSEGHAEKLTSEIPVRQIQLQKLPPRPFGNNLIGPQPSEFTPTSTKAPPTSSPYPSLNHFRPANFPKNIQDVIDILSINNKQPIFESPDTFFNPYRQTQTHPRFVHGQNFDKNENDVHTSKKNVGFEVQKDPFYAYKPKDPGDINLLSTGAFRFASPVWANLRKPNKPLLLPDNTKQTSIKRKVKKPVVVTLNIYPEDVGSSHIASVFPHNPNQHHHHHHPLPSNHHSGIIIPFNDQRRKKMVIQFLWNNKTLENTPKKHRIPLRK